MKTQPTAPSVAIDWSSLRWPQPQHLFGAWLRAGIAVLLLVPGAWGANWLVGSLPFWLVGVPALALVQHHAIRARRARFAAAQRECGRGRP